MKNETIPPKLQEYIEQLDTGSRYLLSFSPFFINHTSLNLITDMVVGRKKSILYICVGRPHIFIQKMLQNRGVGIRDIHFMDMVLYVGRKSRSTIKTAIYFNKEGEIIDLPTIYKLFKVDQEVDELFLDDVDLIILDNISELRTYNQDQQISEFLDLLREVSDKSGAGQIILRFNTKPKDGIPEMCTSRGLEPLDLPNDLFQ
ncbi:MAG: hypothetical protein ACMUIE_05750 [Thermoplasmatota archaeon]